MPVVNIGTVDVTLRPTTVVGNLREVYIVSLPTGVVEVKPVISTVQSHSVVGSPSLSQQMESLDLSALSKSEQAQVRALVQKYKAVFLGHENDLGLTRLISHDIPLLDNVPVHQRYRRIPPSEYEVVKTHIHQLLEAGIVSESCSAYASPIVLVKKKDGSLRMCVDYRHLNAKTRRDAFPLPRIEESFDSLGGSLHLIWPAGICRFLFPSKISQRLRSVRRLDYLNGTVCLLDFVTLQVRSRG